LAGPRESGHRDPAEVQGSLRARRAAGAEERRRHGGLDRRQAARAMNEYRWDDLKIGLRHEFEVTVTPAMMTAFAAMSGDENPLHVDAAYATRAGFRAPVAFGLLTSSFYSQLVGVHLPGRFALLHGIDVDFVTPAFAGEVLRVS